MRRVLRSSSVVVKRNTSLIVIVVLLCIISVANVYLLPRVEYATTNKATAVDLEQAQGDSRRRTAVLDHTEIAVKPSVLPTITDSPVSNGPPISYLESTGYFKTQGNYSKVSVCLANCHTTGIGGKFLAMVILYDLSLTLGFRLFFSVGLPDANRMELWTSANHLYSLFDEEYFYPERCDIVTAGYDRCTLPPIDDLTFKDFHHPLYLMSGNFLKHLYQEKQRKFADEIFDDIQLLRPDRTFVGVHIRLEDVLFGGIADWRYTRQLGVIDYKEAMDYYREKFESKVAFLLMGDIGLSLFRNMSDVVFLEEFIQARNATVTSVECLFLAADVSSRASARIIYRVSNNIYLHMGFHKLNRNTKIEIFDIFAMRIYSNDGELLLDRNFANRYRPEFGKDKMYELGNHVDPEGYVNCTRCYQSYLSDPNQWDIGIQLPVRPSNPSGKCIEWFKTRQIRPKKS